MPLIFGEPAVIIRDSFNRNDAASLGTPETGPPAWTNNTSTHGITGGLAYPSGVVPALSTLPAVADFDAEIKIQVGGAEIAQLTFRMSDTSNFIIAGIDNRAGETDFEMWKNVAGVWTNLIDYNVAPVLGQWYVIRVVAVGSLLRMYLDGVLIGTATETFNQTATRIGLYSATLTGGRYNDLLVRAA